MARFPSGFWGPRPQWALLPVLVMAGIVVSVARGPVVVTARRPIDTDAPADLSPKEAGDSSPADMPIEVRYGVPSPRTAGLWSGRGAD
jgi:hypothetical protein